MSVTTGLAGLLQKKREQEEREAARNRPKAEWFNWKENAKAKNPDVVFVQFLQEFDPSAPGYDEEKGLAVLAVEHEAPGGEGFKARALCTLDDEGQCYACERRQANYEEGWRTKSNLYVNALVWLPGQTGPVVRVISRNFNNSFSQQLMNRAVDDEGNALSITDTVFKITKLGSGKQLVWLLEEGGKAAPALADTADVDVFDINESVLRHIEYDKQIAWYGKVYGGSPEPANSAVADAPEDEAW